jgi:hypothetical protein
MAPLPKEAYRVSRWESELEEGAPGLVESTALVLASGSLASKAGAGSPANGGM